MFTTMFEKILGLFSGLFCLVGLAGMLIAALSGDGAARAGVAVVVLSVVGGIIWHAVEEWR